MIPLHLSVSATMISMLMIMTLCFISIDNSQNVNAEEFIVFVHGLLGFGRDELGGVGYWGFTKLTGNNFTDWMEKQTGLKTFEASVGPLSSNWDRACELYAQILGRRSDYGRAHATKHSHLRLGRDYRVDSSLKKWKYYRQNGFFPKWNEKNKVHFIGHSMGGTTIRMLERLLHEGDAAETALNNAGGYTNDADGAMSDLFQTGNNRDWIASVTTIATPHDGTTFYTHLGSVNQFLNNFLFGVSAVSNGVFLFNGQSDDPLIYDFDMDQHTEFSKPSSVKTPADLKTWFNQILNSPKWTKNYTDLALYELHVHAARDFNSLGPRVYPNTRYIGVQTYKTATCLLNWNDQCPSIRIDPILALTAKLMGDMDDKTGDVDDCDEYNICYGDPWEANDGLVPKISSSGPKLGVPTTGSYAAGSPINHPTNSLGQYTYSKTGIKKGQWYTISANADHLQAIGLSITETPFDAYNHIRDVINAIKNDT